jgi:hypothetical protein
VPRTVKVVTADARAAEVLAQLERHVDAGRELAVVQAPPGSGKTWQLTNLAAHARKRRLRVAIATQTNSQADDICRRLDVAGVPCVRFLSHKAPAVPLGRQVTVERAAAALPSFPCIVVGTTAKWGLVNLPGPFDLCLVEEAWQMKWADFMLLGQVSARFVLIGDPGQIPPVVPVDASRWETAPVAPHLPAPALLREMRAGNGLTDLSLPSTRRLPFDTTTLIRPFYDINFDSVAQPGDRRLFASGSGRRPADAAIDRLTTGSVVGLTRPTPPAGPPLECDFDVAQAAVNVVKRLIERKVEVAIDGKRRALAPCDIGLCATHHVMNLQMQVLLPRGLRDCVVDTPERWQGLERKVFVVVHPLSGVTRPSEFDLETGRLCVMASRHQVGLVLVGRDHIMETLEEHLPSAQQALGRPDVAGRGHHQNLTFWQTLHVGERVVG